MSNFQRLAFRKVSLNHSNLIFQASDFTVFAMATGASFPGAITGAITPFESKLLINYQSSKISYFPCWCYSHPWNLCSYLMGLPIFCGGAIDFRDTIGAVGSVGLKVVAFH